MVAQVSYEELTSVEQSLVEHVGCGEWLDLAAGGEAVDEAAMRSWGESRSCRARVIRDILRGRLAADADPHGDLTRYSDSVSAAWLSAVGWVLRLLAWAFAALFIAGFTSAVRRE